MHDEDWSRPEPDIKQIQKDPALRGLLLKYCLCLSRFLAPSHTNQPQQAAYLERHKLLTDAERESLPVNAFDPVRYVETAG